MALKTPAEQALTDAPALHSTDNPWVQSVNYDGVAVDAEFEYLDQWDQETRSVVAVVRLWIRRSLVADIVYRRPVIVEGTTWYVRQADLGDSVNWGIILTREKPSL